MKGYQILNLLRYKREKSILKESVINTAAQKTRMSFIFSYPSSSDFLVSGASNLLRFRLFCACLVSLKTKVKSSTENGNRRSEAQLTGLPNDWFISYLLNRQQFYFYKPFRFRPTANKMLRTARLYTCPYYSSFI